VFFLSFLKRGTTIRAITSSVGPGASDWCQPERHHTQWVYLADPTVAG
jgi:hypothetical protein